MNIELKKKKERRNCVIRQLIYILLMILSYILISTLQTGASLPLLLIPLAICYASRESPFNSALFGCACGLLLDSAMGKLMGFNAIIIMWASVFTALLFHYILRRHIVNFLLLDLAASAVESLLNYLFFYWIWSYDKSGLVLGRVFIPELIYTNLSGVILYWLTGIIARCFGTVTEHYIEERSDDIVRE